MPNSGVILRVLNRRGHNVTQFCIWISTGVVTSCSCHSWQLPLLPKYYFSVFRFGATDPKHQLTKIKQNVKTSCYTVSTVVLFACEVIPLSTYISFCLDRTFNWICRFSYVCRLHYVRYIDNLKSIRDKSFFICRHSVDENYSRLNPLMSIVCKGIVRIIS